MKYKQGDIVLLPFPFTDLPQSKQRPAVIVSNDPANRHNYIVAKITSVVRADEFSFPLRPSEIDGILKYESEARTNELFTVSPSIILKKFASLKQDALKRLTERIKQHITVE